MGADLFFTASAGKTPQEAFNRAREAAQWEHGHGGYTGTIAEKGGYVLAKLPPRMTARKLSDLLDEAEDCDVTWPTENVADAKREVARQGTGRSKAAVAARTWLRRAEKELKDAQRARAKFERKAGASLSLIDRLSPTYRDKWGDAICVEVTSRTEKATYATYHPTRRGERLYVFMGWASC